jgi:tRNA G10  N-methylase Trm11
MPQYAAVLGHQPHISLAELAAVIPGFSLESIEAKQVALFSASDTLDENLIDLLGGSVMLAQRITEADVSMEDVPRLLSGEVTKVKKKVTFGLRCYNVPKGDIKTAYRNGKAEMKRQGRPCRYIGNEKKPAATALLKDSEVVSGKKGVELFIVGKPNELWVGKTIGIQDIDAYTFRDMEKPVRDTTVGLLPPKLAQILLNFGGWMAREALSEEEKKKNSARKRKKKEVYTVLDPFCGTGVILIECLLRGWNVEASDNATKAVNGSKKNLDWIRKERKILKKDVSDSVSKHDATKPFSLKTLPDIVVTETSLGPNLSKKPTKTDVKKMVKESEKLQEAFLQNATATLPGVPLVCTWPFWRLGNENVRLEKIWSALEKAGYEAVLPDETEVEDADRPSLLYQRKDQFVGREIVLLRPISQS